MGPHVFTVILPAYPLAITPSQGYIRAMDVSQRGLVARAVGSGAGTNAYWCDHQWVNNAQLDMALFGGDCYAGLGCGAFACGLHCAVGGHGWTIVASPSLHPNAAFPRGDAWIYIRSMQWSQYGPLFAAGGSPASTAACYCDGMIAHNDSTKRMALFGGFCNGGLACGAFACDLHHTVGYHNWHIVASPSYLPSN